MSRITDQIDRILKKYETAAFFAGGASRDEIQEARQRLGTVFPEDYRRFLAGYGAGSFGEWEIYGILPGKDIPSIPNGIWATGYLRQTRRLPESYLAVAFDGAGGYYCIDTSRRDEDGLCPVVLWLTEEEENESPEEEAESFEKFFLERLKEQIDKMI